MAEERCEITELITSQCSHCTGRGEEVPDGPDPAKVGPWFAARYPGRCSQCDGQFSEEDRIRADGEGGYLCEKCGRVEGQS